MFAKRQSYNPKRALETAPSSAELKRRLKTVRYGGNADHKRNPGDFNLIIECQWLGRQTGSQLERNFYADIGLAVDDNWLTLLEDREAKTVNHHLRGCAHHLATWFAVNWWRLRWEPEPGDWINDTDWRIAHSVAAAGGGYIWPNVIFASNGESLAVTSHTRSVPAPFEPVRYLNAIATHITAAEFERKVDAFLAGVLSRMDSLGIHDDNLPALWSEVVMERRDPGCSRRRKLEALCGYDPDEAPEEMLAALIEDKFRFGESALEEVAAEGRHSSAKMLEPILDLARSQAKPARGGFRGTLPDLNVKRRHDAKVPPWKQAAKLAHLARSKWGLTPTQPIANKALADLLGTKETIFTNRTPSPTSLPIALRTNTNGSVDLYFNSKWSTSRRFSASRLIGDHLHCARDERLLPATKASTARQQFQRAFAQEFLCPFDALVDKIQTDQPDEDDIETAADHFGVSPLMVQTTLVNKCEIGREYVYGRRLE